MTASAMAAMAAMPATAFASEAPSSVHLATKAAASTKTYVVQRGDSLWSIAQRFHTTVSTLEQLNHLSSSSVLRVGQRLAVPGSTQTSSRSGGGLLDTALAEKGQAIASYARQFVGVPYQWAGSSPRGFDCSGLVAYVYGHFGMNLPHSSYSMYGMGQAVSSANLAPGDLVFFNTNGPGASHVGIFLGGNQFISAQGSGVQLASLSDSYWRGHYVGARDLLH